MKEFDLNDFEDFELISSKLNIINEYEKFEMFNEKIKELPLKDLIKRRFLKDENDLNSLYLLFSELNNKSLPLFKKSNTSNNSLIFLWLSQITHKAKKKFLFENMRKFEGIDKEYLVQITKLSQDENILIELPNILKEKGIILLFEPTINDMKLDGTTFLLENGTPVIGLTIRHKRLDNFWFTLLHELSHILLHYEELETPILDDLDIKNQDIIELQANKLTKDSFVSMSEWRICTAKSNQKSEEVIKFANKLNIHPAIIAGLIRFEKNNYTLFNDIINTIDVREKIYGKN